MLSGTVWPGHPHPLPDELLSSWLVRIAEANGVKLQTMTRQLFGTDLTPWNRDIDRSAPEWLIAAMMAHTGLNRRSVLQTTMRGYQPRLFGIKRKSGQLRWLLPVESHSTNRRGFCVQYCPACLAGDEVPYFRRRWRIGFHTACAAHQCLLQDACPACGAPVVFHRRDFGVDIRALQPICCCNACKFDLREAKKHTLPPMPPEVIARHQSIMEPLLAHLPRFSDANFAFLEVLHQLCKVMVSVSNRGELRRHVAKQVGIEPMPLLPGRVAFEQRRLPDRHQVLSLGLWLLASPTERLRQAWEEKAVRYNHLVKDFEGMPGWFGRIVVGMNRGSPPRK